MIIPVVASNKLLLFGDSITQGSYNQDHSFASAPALQHWYVRTLQVIGRGFSGYTTEWCRYILGPILAEENLGHGKVKLTVIFLGANDCADKQKNPLQHVPLDRYKENVAYMIQQAVDTGSKVIVVGPAPVDELSLVFDDRSSALTKQYCDGAIEVAKHHNVGYVDLWSDFLASVGYKPGDPVPGTSASPVSIEHLFTDGLHFSGDGYKILFESIQREIETKYPELTPEKLPWLLPLWNEIDNDNLPDSIFKKSAL